MLFHSCCLNKLFFFSFCRKTQQPEEDEYVDISDSELESSKGDLDDLSQIFGGVSALPVEVKTVLENPKPSDHEMNAMLETLT
jgi:hypothetical protein